MLVITLRGEARCKAWCKKRTLNLEQVKGVPKNGGRKYQLVWVCFAHDSFIFTDMTCMNLSNPKAGHFTVEAELGSGAGRDTGRAGRCAQGMTRRFDLLGNEKNRP